MTASANPSRPLSAAASRISRDRLAGRLEPFLIARLDPQQRDFALRSFVPELRWNRLDLAIKLSYAQTLGADQPSFVRHLYDAHIHAFSLGDMKEPGNDDKVRLERFRDDFAAMIDGLAAGGFDPQVSLVPLARDGSILNGAHRTAAAMSLGKPITAVETGLDPFRFDHDYFRRRGMAEELIEAAALLYLQNSPDARLSVAPVGAAPRDSVVYQRDLKLGECATGRLKREWPGLPTFPAGRLRLSVCDPAGQSDRTAHQTTDHAETLRLARLLLNPQSRRFLDQATPEAFGGTMDRLKALRDEVQSRGDDPQTALVGPDLMMAAFGLRPAGNAPALVPDDLRIDGLGRADILADPRLHFHFAGLAFVTPELAARMLAGNAAEVGLLAPLLKGPGRAQAMRQRLSRSARLVNSRLRRSAIALLARLGVKDRARRAYGALRRR